MALIILWVFFVGVHITIGSVLEESQKDDYFHKKPCAKAREMLVLKWAMIGFFFTISYKSVLLSNMINIEYEKPLDTVEDILRSDKPVFIESGMIDLLKSDPREKIKELFKKAKSYETEVTEKGNGPVWIQEGYGN